MTSFKANIRDLLFSKIRIFAYVSICLLGLGNIEAQVSSAIFEASKLTIPFTKIEDKVYQDLVLAWDGSVSFAVVSVGEVLEVANNSPTAEYFPATSELQIGSLSANGKPYLDAVFYLNQQGEFEFSSIRAAYSSTTEDIYVELSDFPVSENPALTMQMVSLIDLNLDGKKDIVAHVWHANWNAGNDFYGPVPNKILIYLQDENRGFKLSNLEVFGEGDVDLSGSATRKQSIGDFNGDGYPDLAYAMNREDGRPAVFPDTPNWGALPIVLLSNGDGTYSVTQPGDKSLWYHGVTSVPNGFGYDDVLYRSELAGGNALAYRYINGSWTSVAGYPRLDGWEIQARKNIIFSTGTKAVELFNFENNSWSSISKIEFTESNEEILVQTWNGDMSTQKLITVLGKDRTATAFSESCIINDGSLYVTQMDSRLPPTDWRSYEYVVETEMEKDAPFLIFEIRDGGLLQNSDLMPYQEQESLRHSYRFQCRDVNADGRDDIFVSTEADGSNLLYLQKPDLNFELQSELIFPAPMPFPNKGQVRSIFEDIDGDGLEDLMYYTNTPTTREKTITFQIHWAEQVKAKAKGSY